MNDLVVRHFGTPAAADQYFAAATRAVESVGSFDGRDILKLDQETGAFVFGQDNTELHKDDLVAVHPFSMHHGYIAFDGRDIAYTEDGDSAEMFFPISRPLPRFEDLAPLEEPRKARGKGRGGEDRGPRWLYQLGYLMTIVEGPNAGKQLVYKPTSMGGHRMVKYINDEILRERDTGSADLVPVIELWSEDYKTRDHGKKVFNPLCEVIDWYPLDAEETKGQAKASKGAEKHPKRDERTAKGDKVDRRRDDRDVIDDQDEDGNPRRSRRYEDGTPRRNPAPDSRKRASDDELREKGRKAREEIEQEGEHDEPEEDVSPRGRSRDRDEPKDRKNTRSSRRDRDADTDERATRSSSTRTRSGRDDAGGDRKVRDNGRDEPRGESRDEPEDDARPIRRQRNRARD